jgi:hypothetical protein
MVRRRDGDARELKGSTPSFPEPQARAQESAKGRRPEGHDHLRPHRFDFGQEMEPTRVPFVRFRPAIPGGSTLHHVRDEDGIPSKAGGLQSSLEDPPRTPDERPSREVLVLAGSLPDEENGRLDRSFAGHGDGPGRVEPTSCAAANGGRRRFEDRNEPAARRSHGPAKGLPRLSPSRRRDPSASPDGG